ncbi:MAG: aminotransferase class I/II-fold pyridoxal phosphate-dependent enzyme [Pseudomonadota bacterium]
MRNFALETFFSRWEFTARYHMTASDVETLTVGALCELAGTDTAAVLDEQQLGYIPTWGTEALRETIATTYDELSAEDILCFAGAEEGIYAAMRVMLKAGDHAIVAVPNYQAAETLPLDICDVTGVELHADSGWRLDLDELRDALRPNTVLVSVNFPNNPTGAIMPPDDFAALVALCRERGIYLFCDEVYRMLELDPGKRLPQAAEAYEKGLSLNVMSKSLGLPGLRIGWIACRDRALLTRMERYKHYLSICNSAVSERLAVLALGVRDTILSRNRALMRTNLEKLDAFFAKYGELFDWRHPDGSCVAFPKYKGDVGVEDFCETLVNETGVLLLPSSVYRSELMTTPADRFRIGFGRAGIDEGLATFADYLDTHHGS